MVLYSLITLDYDPATDVLELVWPDIKDFLMPEVEREVTVLIDTIKHYDVKKLLVDTSKAMIELKEEEYQSFIATFASALKNTRLQKFARISTNDPEREKMSHYAQENSRIEQAMEFRNFATKAEALAWLKA